MKTFLFKRIHLNKYVYFLVISLSITANLFSQEASISTEFSQEGILYKNFNNFSKVLVHFESNEPCIVIDYFGKDIFKVKYKDWTGYVDSQYLVFTDAITDLFYAYQERERIKTIEAEKKRKEHIQEVVSENEEANRQLALKELAKKEEALKIQKKRQDSIAKLYAETTKKAEGKTSLKNQEVDVKEPKVKRIDKTSNTCDFSINEFDPIDRVEIVRINPETLSKNLTVELFKRGKIKNVFFNLFEDLGCTSYLPGNRSFVKVTLENNQTITFYHSWDMDCGEFSLKGNISNSQIRSLKNSPIKSIFLKGTKLSRNIVDIDYKTFFIDKLNCID
ncbi:hypothetical protein ACFQ1R_00130 [Mariniflexile jejuense]|uniref:SH3 domain-containing protein n=1 Tax=Mariniflexile jejuense TaxID=1173582 RepID=A0ABW3JDZ8_9FLAO